MRVKSAKIPLKKNCSLLRHIFFGNSSRKKKLGFQIERFVALPVILPVRRLKIALVKASRFHKPNKHSATAKVNKPFEISALF